MAEWYPIVSQLSYQFICWWTFGCCHLLATVDSAAMNIHVKYIFESLFSVFRHMYLLVELLVMRRLCFLQGMPVPSHVHHPANPFVSSLFWLLTGSLPGCPSCVLSEPSFHTSIKTIPSLHGNHSIPFVSLCMLHGPESRNCVLFRTSHQH